MSRLAFTLLSAFALAGCGATPSDSSEVGGLGDTEEIATTEQAVVPNTCGSVTPQSSTTLTVGSTGSEVKTVNAPYGSAACPKATRFNLQHFNGRAGTTVAYAARVPTNEGDCRKIFAGQIMYDSNNRQVGQRTGKFGNWSGNTCFFPIASNDAPLPAGVHHQWVQALDQFDQPAAVRVTLFALP